MIISVFPVQNTNKYVFSTIIESCFKIFNKKNSVCINTSYVPIRIEVKVKYESIRFTGIYHTCNFLYAKYLTDWYVSKHVLYNFSSLKILWNTQIDEPIGEHKICVIRPKLQYPLLSWAKGHMRLHNYIFIGMVCNYIQI